MDRTLLVSCLCCFVVMVCIGDTFPDWNVFVIFVASSNSCLLLRTSFCSSLPLVYCPLQHSRNKILRNKIALWLMIIFLILANSLTIYLMWKKNHRKWTNKSEPPNEHMYAWMNACMNVWIHSILQSIWMCRKKSNRASRILCCPVLCCASIGWNDGFDLLRDQIRMCSNSLTRKRVHH